MTLRFLLLAALLVLGNACTITSAQQTTPVLEKVPAVLVYEDSSEAGSNPSVELRERVWRQPYLVGGRTGVQIREQLDALSPLNTAAGHFDAETAWDLRWSFRFRERVEGCSLSAALVEIEIVLVVPQLKEPAAADPRWQAFTDALDAHEQGHIDREIESARRLQADLSEAGTARTCSELAQRLNALGEAAKQTIRAEDEAYDLATGHGRTQGAVYP